MILFNSLLRWMMLLIGGIMIIMSIFTMIASKQSKKSIPKWSFFSLIIGIILLIDIIIRMMANSYNTF